MLGPPPGALLADLLRDQARRGPDRPALVSNGQVTTYRELDSRVDRIAARLRRLRIGAGDRVVVQLPNGTEFMLLLFAFFRLGVIPVLALPVHRKNEIHNVCGIAGAVGIVIPRRRAGFDFRAMAEAVRADNPTLREIVTADDVCDVPDALPVAGGPRPTVGPAPAGIGLLLLSGGTTGAPKLIPRTHRDYALNVVESARLCGLDEHTVYLAALPAAHNFALGCPGVLGTLAVGGKVVLAPDPSPDEAFQLIEQERVTVTALTPPLLQLWLAEAGRTRADLTSLRLLQVGGAPLSRKHAERVRPELGCRLQQVFGMAEGLLSFTRPDDPEEIVVSTQGRPLLAEDEIRVVDREGRDVAVGEAGELLARGPYTVRGYYRAPGSGPAPESDATAFTPDGYYRTGDLVRLTGTGHLVVEGRLKDAVNRGGEKVPAVEVEDHLLAHPLVAQAAVVGVPDELLGERTCAFVVPRTRPPRLPEIAAFLRDRGLAAYKLPDRLEIVADLPRTGVGKVDKHGLAARLERPASRKHQKSRELA
ncbi:(2,3-dihydroxybenzoyl)adenylate synthase [Streptomyces luteolus]|uniref:AMP-binding protein n=1 Tax=Streptomyces luteolus TaxID=3043615 RepID=A0ABT6SVF3_9ACTN|nr:AMP-binding protein [Streptomyces sp. B-S-A12]MDI3419579.1 AMP-binding protein [Streptomyces sp. B-S-A12]